MMRLSLLIAVMLGACLVLANTASVRAKLAEATPLPSASLAGVSPLRETPAESPAATATPPCWQSYDQVVLPAVYTGTATIDGEPAPDGTTIQAVMNGIVWGTTEVGQVGQGILWATPEVRELGEGGYEVLVPETLVLRSPCGEFELGTVEFYIDGLKADESSEWRLGEHEVNLTFFTRGSGIPAPPAWRTPTVVEWPPLPTTPTPAVVLTPTPAIPLTPAGIPSPHAVAMPTAVPAGGLGTQLVGGRTWWPLGLVAAAGLVGAAALIAFGAEAWYARKR